MSEEKMSASVIETATVLMAMKEIERETGQKGHATPDIGFYLQRPEKYDMGGKLFSLTNSGFLTKERKENKHNLYYLTDHGRQYLEKNLHKVQKYGCYDDAHERRTLTPKRSQTALDAIAMLQKHIADNEKILMANQQIVNIIDDLLEDIGE